MNTFEGFREQLTSRLNDEGDKIAGKPIASFSLEGWEKYRDDNEKTLNPLEMDKVVSVAVLTLRNVYVHKDLKRARRGVDPVSQLEVLRAPIRDGKLGIREFHLRMLDIFKSLGDVHTAYRRPEPYKNAIAFLPFLIKAYFDENGERRFLVKQVLWKRGEVEAGQFDAGVEIVTWNGTRMEEAVRRSAAFEEGSNEPHDFALGLQFMTVRWLGASFEPDAPTVTVGYRVPGDRVLEYQAPWSVLVREGGPRLLVSGQASDFIFGESRPAQQADRALHVAHQTVHYWRRKLFKGPTAEDQSQGDLSAAAEELMSLFNGYVGRVELQTFTNGYPSLLGIRGEEVPSLLPAYFEARIYKGADLLERAKDVLPREHDRAERTRIFAGQFGYIRIRAFALDGPEQEWFKYEFRRLLSVVPSQGLIIDIRDNPGGSARNAEASLQFLTPKTITPLPFRFPASRETMKVAARGNYSDYVESIASALETGSAFSAGLPITPPEFANALGQYYFGPTVLITSAMTYSAGDIFAAGFEDCAVGSVIGVDETTGGGGANCWFYEEDIRPKLESDSLPGGINMQVAVRQCTRVGRLNSGVPVEELGVPVTRKRTREDQKDQEDKLYRLTRLDVSEPCSWGLFVRAARELVNDHHLCDLRTTLQADPGGKGLTAVAATEGIDRLDFYLDGRPTPRDVLPAGETGGTAETAFPFPALGRTRLEIQGFARQDGHLQLVARSVAVFNGSIELARRTPRSQARLQSAPRA